MELKEIINEVYSWFGNKSLNIQEYNEFKLMVSETIKTFYPELISYTNNLDDVLEVRYQIVNIKENVLINKYTQDFLRCEDRDLFFDENYLVFDKTTFTPLHKKLYERYDYLFKLPQPVQKSKEWFDMRNNMITASNCGTVIGECKYSPIKNLLLDKIGLGEKFKENKFVYHGKKYEKIAIMIYENIYNSKVGEFGLIQHPTISYLGASPDGISMSLTLDGKFNKLLGRMLEIKCPPSRKIVTNGIIKGDICPDYYWIQVQIQLECCNLPECDFWQCHLIEYESEEEFNEDDVDNFVHSDNELYVQNIETEIIEPAIKKYIDKRIRKGAIIELLPINKSKIPKGEPPIWYGKYIYPPVITMNELEYKKWTTDTIKNLNTLYPELVNEYKFSRVVYWKLESSHNELIIRQKEWFEKNREYYRIFWNRVLYYRNHIDFAKQDLIDKKIPDKIFLNSTLDRIITNEDIFIKQPTLVKKDKFIDEFLSSSEKKEIKKPIDEFLSSFEKKKEIKKETKKPIDEFLSSSEKKETIKKNINKIQKVVKPNIPVYKSPSNNDDLELVIIGENRKKKNKK